MTRASGDRGPLCFAASVGGDLGRPLSGAVVGCSWEGGASTVPTRGERKGMSMDATTGKALMRAQFKAVREGLSVGERCAIDEAIARNVAALPEFAAADGVFTYLSFGAEVDTRELIQRAWEAGKTVCLPRVVPSTREMRWYAVESFDGLVRSSFGVEEPPDDPSREVRPAVFACPVALVPGLAFDREGFRLGYGGGFYDTFLPAFPGTSIGLIRACQLVDRLSVRDIHDAPVNIVALEQGSAYVAKPTERADLGRWS